MCPARGTLRVDSERTRKQILRSARALFHDVGYEHVRMADLAEHVGCSRATLYNHFASRDELLVALCVEYLDGYLDISQRIAEWVQPGHSVFDVLKETVELELRWRAANGELRGVLDTARQQKISFYVEADKRIDDALLAWFGSIYSRSADAGLLRPALDIPFATGAIYAMIDHVVAAFDVNTPPVQLVRAADLVARLQWHALYVGEPEAAPLYVNLPHRP